MQHCNAFSFVRFFLANILLKLFQGKVLLFLDEIHELSERSFDSIHSISAALLSL